MKNMNNTCLKCALGVALVIVFFVMFSSTSKASEGIVELRNNIGGDSRCFAPSVLMTNFRYKILLSCRDLVYPAPAAPNIFTYVLWAQAAENDKTQNLGTLGVGRGEFETKIAFSRLFVTQEYDAKARKPSDRVIMQGSVQPVALLEPGQPSKVVETVETSADQEEPTVAPTDAPKVVEDASDAQSGGGLSILRVVGGVLLGVIVFVVIVGLISTSRRRPIE